MKASVISDLEMTVLPLSKLEEASGMDIEIGEHLTSVRHALEGVLNEFRLAFEVIDRGDTYLSPVHEFQAKIAEALIQLRLISAGPTPLFEKLRLSLLRLTK
ncbi:hypothetical protein JFT60_21030 [Pseudomonas sp. MF6772]|uniref:hypothetical protein n=1 Tax=Pseudomonas sp. MF6772 TaxID=2797533 RepID=UPI0018E77D85|nr:hypothetical protein [Pseudomonas sp. MF6772]MBJ2269874.1 hypothetical protein [Pseudomonas sp. MF6772]